MKNIYQIAACLLTAICLLAAAGCSNKNIAEKGADGQDLSEERNGDLYGFTEFEVRVDTKDQKEAIDALYKEGRDNTEAYYLNKIEDKYERGNKAMKPLNKIFEKLDIDPETDDFELIKKVMEAVEISDYTTVTLKIKFKGHDKKELQFSK